MFPEVNEQMDIIRRGVEEIIPEDELVQKIEKSRKTNKPLIIKEGFDPTAPDLHIGHMVSIRKLRDFQELGHTVVFLIGDFTGLVGDPSGRSTIRKMMTREEIDQNAETYKDQIFKVLDPKKTVVRFNSEWLGKLNIYEFIELATKQTIARMLERDDFKNRFENNTDISMSEFIYPLLQGYDSVALKSDVEIGGTDQKFNLLMARVIQKRYGVESQAVITLPLLEGTSGGDKMSKSFNNYIGVNDPPSEIFGKVMSIPDTLIYNYFLLATSVATSELENISKKLKDESVNPVTLKRKLGKAIVNEYYSEESAEEAEQAFDRVFKERENPLNIEEVSISIDQPIWIVKLLSIAGMVQTNGEGRRMIKQGAVSVNGEKIVSDDSEISLESGAILKVGKRKFKKIILK